MERDMLWMYDKEENRLINEHDEEFYLNNYPTLKSRLQIIMKESGLNQYQLAKQSGVSRSLINMVMTEKRDSISEDTAKAICQAASRRNLSLRYDPDFLMGKTGSMYLSVDPVDMRWSYEKQEDELLALICNEILPKCGITISENRVLGDSFLHWLTEKQFANANNKFEIIIDESYRDTYVTDFQNLVNDIYDSIRFLVIRYAKKHQVRDFSIGRPIE